MPNNLVFSIRFLQPYSHGRGDGGDPEWPPSPLRLLQALVASAAAHWNERQHLEYAVPALRWLESLEPPLIIATTGVASDKPYRLYVPDNLGDKVAKGWLRGSSASIAEYRTDKDVCPIRLLGDSLHYLFAIPEGNCEHLEILRAAARTITYLGWGIDMVAGDASIVTESDAEKLEGVRWSLSPAGRVSLRVPKQGTLSDLMRKHADFLNRVSADGFRPVPPLRMFDVMQYRSQYDTASRPIRLFELRDLDGSRFRYSHRKLIHIAGMVRHLAINAMKTAGLPRGVPDDWIETYVAGHRKERKADLKNEHKCKGSEEAGQDVAASATQREAFDGSDEHRQLSYLPLPSVGLEHTDPGIRRVMIVAPVGDDALLDHVARRLAGQQLIARNEKAPEFGVDENGQPKPGPLLVPLPRSGDGVTRKYTGEATVWYSFTPVILPGHDDHKPAKTRKLILKALAQSGIDQPCEFEWSAFSRFSKSYSAHKYVRDERAKDGKSRIGYIRPDHLLNQTAVHLVLRFGQREDPNDPESRWIPADHPIPGPLTIGAGRHCGFGLMAAVP